MPPDPPPRLRRLGLAGPVGALVLVAALLVAAHHGATDPLVGGYLSDLGGAAMPGATAFRAGLVAMALGCLGVAVAAGSRRSWRDPRVLLLTATAVDLVLQTVMRCEAACRLPVEGTAVPAADAAHFVVAAAGFALWVAVTAYDVVDAAPIAPRLSAWATASYAAHLTLLGVLLLVDPYGSVSAVLQRTLVLTGLVWTSWVGVALAPGGGQARVTAA